MTNNTTKATDCSRGNGKKISVIIPLYNGEEHLHECLKSVVGQTLEDIEIICINDGSTDQSLDILKEYASADARFKVIDQKNSGSGIARNKGLVLAEGEFVIFIDSDDYYPDNSVLQTLYDNAKKHNALICGGSFVMLFNGEIYSHHTGTLSGYTFDQDGFIEYGDYQFDYGYHRFVYNREFLRRNNIVFPDYKRFQDPPFFVTAMILAQRFYVLKKNTYVFRVKDALPTFNTQQIRDILKGIQDNLVMSHKHNLSHLHRLTVSRLVDSVHRNEIVRHIKEWNLGIILQFIKTKRSINHDSMTHIDPALTTIVQEMSLYKLLLEEYVQNGKSLLNKYMQSSKSLLSRCLQLLKKCLQTIFSVRNEGGVNGKTHKVITILGIKAKFKRNTNVNISDAQRLRDNLTLLQEKKSIYWHYYRCKVLAKLTFGEKRKHYKAKRDFYHEKVRRIREIYKQK